MKIQAFGCTHGFHEGIKIEEGVDMLIHTGDESNSRAPEINRNECINFLEWYAIQDAKYKIFVAGNHSTAIEKKLVRRDEIEEYGIIYLEHESIEIEGLKIFGSPYTPNFNDWSFMRDRSKMDKLWKHIPDDTDILIIHGPPKGILDLTEDRDAILKQVGDMSLLTHIKRVRPKHHFFSHVHDRGVIQNRGTKIQGDTQYHNVNCVEDGKFSKGLQSNGLIINI